jgi:hypothetical protein
MGGFNPGGPDRVLQEFIANPQGLIYSSPVYFDGKIYLQGVGDVLKAFALKLDPATNTMMLDETPVSQGTIVSGFPGTVESISANGTSNGIVWSPKVDGFATGDPAILRAYNANNLTTSLYSSNQAGPRDTAGGGVKFTTPTIANGMVYLGTQFEVDVYGLLPRSNAGRNDVGSGRSITPDPIARPGPHIAAADGVTASSLHGSFAPLSSDSNSGASPSTIAQDKQTLNMDFGTLVASTTPPASNTHTEKSDALFHMLDSLLLSLESRIEALDPQMIAFFQTFNAELGALESGIPGHPITI